MSSHTIEDLTSCILDFQAHIIRITYRRKTTLVDLENEPSQVADLRYIWSSSNLSEEQDEHGQNLKWRKLGFDSEDIEQEFNDVGLLGLDCLVNFASRLSTYYPFTDFCFIQKNFVQRDPDFSKVRNCTEADVTST